MYIVSQTYIGKEKSGHNSRAVLHRKTHQAHINSRHGNVPYQSQESEKGGQADNWFLKRRCYDNRVIHHTAASRGGPENRIISLNALIEYCDAHNGGENDED